MRPTNSTAGSSRPSNRFADLDGPDYFPTPRWATHALIDNEEFEGNIWECACGDGAMSKVLEFHRQDVYSSDLYQRPYGDAGKDFLTTDRRAANIVTNPPYNSAEGFVHSGLKKADRKLALLLRLAFLEGGNRNRTIFNAVPPRRVWVFSERITFLSRRRKAGRFGHQSLCLVCVGQAGPGTDRTKVV